MNVEIWTDGACSGNPGRGGWGCILRTQLNDGRIYTKEHSGGYEKTTNNRMELIAIIKALKCLNGSYDVEIYSDSAYVCNAYNKNWIASWKDTGWKYGKLKNIDLWMKLDDLLMRQNSFKLIHVKGHSSNQMNNRCDELAVAARKRHVNELERDLGYNA